MMSARCYFPRIHMGEQHNERRRNGRVHVRWWAVAAALAAGISLVVVSSAANADSSITVTQGDFELTCPTNTVAEGASLTCTLKNTAASAKPWPAVAILHLSTDTDRALVRGTSIDVNLGAPSPAADIDGGVTWIGETLVGYSRFDWSGNAGAKDAAGDSRTVNIVAAHDGVDEDSESFYVALGPDASKGVGLLFNNKASVTLTDNDSPSTDTSLSSLAIFAGQSHTLSPTQAAVSQAVAYEVTEATLTAEAARGTTMTMSASFDGNGVDLDGSGGTSIEVTSGEESAAVPLGVGTTTVTLTVTAEDGTTTGTRTLSIARSALGDDVDTVAVSLPSFTLTCPAEVEKGTDGQCTLRASGSAGWPVVAVMHSSADGASRALVAEDPIIPDTHPDYSKDVSLGAQQPARTAFNHGYGELFSGGSRALYRTYGYEKFDWTGTASAGDSRTVTIELHDNAGNRGQADEVFYVALAPSDYTGLSQLVDNKVPVVIKHPVSVTGVEVISDTGDDVYGLSEVISVRVTFGEAVDVTGTPTLGIDMDPASWGRKDAVYSSGSGTAELVFTHQVTAPNVSSQGIAVLADTLTLNGGTIRTRADGTDVGLGHSGLDHDPAHKVDWQRSPNNAPASVTGVEVISDTGGDDVYGLSEMILVRVAFSEAVEVTGTPTLGIDMDPAHWGRKDAVYTSGSGTTELIFTHHVTWPNLSTQGIAVLADTLSLAGGSIRSVSSQIDAELAHSGLDHDPDHTVDWRRWADDPVIELLTMWCDNLVDQRWTLREPPLNSIGKPFLAGSLVAGSCAANDPRGGTIWWSLTGADADRFEISADGQLSFAEAPDFESPADSDGDNVYEVTITATASGQSTSLDVAVAVTDVYEVAPIIISPQPDPDAPTGAAVSGAELTLTFAEEFTAIDAATAGALKWAFLIDGGISNSGDQAGTPINNQSPNAVAVDGATLTLTLGAPVPAGVDVTVRYVAAAAGTGNSLKDADGNAVEDFTATLTTTQRD